MSRCFQRYVGIDYSGAGCPDSRLSGLELYLAEGEGGPVRVSPVDGGRWSRRSLAAWLASYLAQPVPTIAGLDHGFSLPLPYLEARGLDTWDALLAHVAARWPTADQGVSVESLRRDREPGVDPQALRLCETWIAGAKSVFLFDVQGSVAKSTLAGLPWLGRLRAEPALQRRMHVWPFDGWLPAAGSSLLAEVYPSLLRHRYRSVEPRPDRRDAWSVARWLQDMDGRGALGRYFQPPLTAAERRRAALEGWILGVG